VERAITGFVQDDEGHWVALLECGHRQHLRHDPPLTERPLVLTSEGRQSLVGQALWCKVCIEEASARTDRDDDIV